MIEQTEQVLTSTLIRYTAPAADTSQMVAEVRDGIATFTVGGTIQTVPVATLPAYLALVATVHAAIVPTPADPEPIPDEPTTEGEPS